MTTIPGLKSKHFVRTSSVKTAPPMLLCSNIGYDGSFYFQWKSTCPGGYTLSAKGYSPKRMIVKCGCPQFYFGCEGPTFESEKGDIYVCEHLAAALDNVVDRNSATSIESLDDFGKHGERCSAIIPGLTRHHFTRGSSCAAYTRPKLLKDRVELDGYFDFEWCARGAGGEDYTVIARGNISQKHKYQYRRWWSFHEHCECRDFETQKRKTQKSGWRTNYVCKHLAAALETVIDDDVSVEVRGQLWNSI